MVSVEPTPNPNAMKISVGKPVGGPSTWVVGKETDDPMAAALLELPGDFVTISKTPDASWDDILELASGIIEEHHG